VGLPRGCRGRCRRLPKQPLACLSAEIEPVDGGLVGVASDGAADVASGGWIS
jgi:hypothetical protein